ncbi:hypothetical protein [Streptomyces sp. NRRL S-87]|uniref:hypothetical protein n=1 Tax=Streptomyces sp. NRRL S-87 TaxID=1463920 RepID=UPI00131D7A5E|nr:hypothetical protein [Streptomyces sp. NRRL S-87]
MVVVVDVAAVTEELFGLRPAEFTAARDAYVARARRERDTDAARALGRLRRPTLALWAANLLVRARPDRARDLVRLGAELRAAHRELDGARLRTLSHEQHALVAELAAEAARLVAARGERAAPGLREDTGRILLGLLADEAAGRDWADRRLTAAPAPRTGFEGLEPAPGALPPPAPVRTRPAPAPKRSAETADAPVRSAETADAPVRSAETADAPVRSVRERAARERAGRERAARLAAARRVRDGAEEELRRARAALADAADARRATRAEAAALRSELDALRTRLAAAEAAADSAEAGHRRARQELRRADRAAEEAAADLRAAERDAPSGPTLEA